MPVLRQGQYGTRGRSGLVTAGVSDSPAGDSPERAGGARWLPTCGARRRVMTRCFLYGGEWPPVMVAYWLLAAIYLIAGLGYVIVIVVVEDRIGVLRRSPATRSFLPHA